MSFTFNWPRFSEQFHYDAIQMLNTALNKGNKPPIIADKIEVVELEMGTQPPELEIRDIGDLTVDQFRGIFRLTYAGDAHLLLKTKVQANPLNHKHTDIHLMSGSRGMLAAKNPLVVPMLLRLSHFRLNSYVVLVVSKQKGITLVFKTDPLQNVDINSTFDSIAVIQKFIQKEIEGQLRQMFREELPGIIHRLSQQWVKAKVEAPYLQRRFASPPLRRTHTSESMPTLSQESRQSSNHVPPYVFRQQCAGSLGYNTKAHSDSGAFMAESIRRQASCGPSRTNLTHEAPTSSTSSTSHPDLEGFDPTYGLRPEGLPTRSIFQSFSKLFTPSKGLADLTEEPSEDLGDYDETEAASFDMLDWDASSFSATSPSVFEEPQPAYETVPAVGGGTITRPRIYHAQSSIHPLGSRIDTPREQLPQRPSIFHERRSFPVDLDGCDPSFSNPSGILLPEIHLPLHRAVTPDSQETRHSQASSLPTPPSLRSYQESLVYLNPPNSPIESQHHRRLSVSSSSLDGISYRPGSPTSHLQTDSKIVLRPSLNHSIHQLSTLSHSNHTLSPFTRSLEHFTVRSVPPRIATSTGNSFIPDRMPAKARRRRTFHLGRRSQPEAPPPITEQDIYSLSAPSSPAPNSDFDASDMDRYFRSIDELRPSPPSASTCPSEPALRPIYTRKGIRTT